jgi:hypothetical protein
MTLPNGSSHVHEGSTDERFDLFLRIDGSPNDKRATVVFRNRGNAPVWFPSQSRPSYRDRPGEHCIGIWLGYFDEVQGAVIMEGNLLPQMQLVEPGGAFEIGIAWPDLVSRLTDPSKSALVIARVALKEIYNSGVSGQPVAEYLDNSVIVRSKSSCD